MKNIIECQLCGTTFQNFNTRTSVVRCPNCGSQKTQAPNQSHLVHKLPQPRRAPDKVLPKYSKPEPLQKNIETEIKAVGLKVIDKADIVGRFQCVNCLNYFEFNVASGTPSCPKCGEIELIKITSPLARIVTQEDKAPLSLADVKRYRFIIRNWKKYKQIEQQIHGLRGLLHTSDLGSDKIKDIDKVMNDTLLELDRAHETKIEEYMSRRKS